jgi:HEXXH motif-containing protein
MLTTASSGDVSDADQLTLIPDLLTWDANSVGPEERIQRTYNQAAQRNLSAFVSALNLVDRRSAREIGSVVASATDADLARILLAPATTYRLAGGADSLNETTRFLIDSFTADAARRGESVVDSRPLWSALGDTLISRGHVESWSAQSIPVDFFSIHGKDLENTHFDLPEAERPAAIRKVVDALGLIEAISPDASRLVRGFTKVLVLKGDHRANFSSGSAAQYVGRSVLGNPHSPGADVLTVAEALVHEAIHSVLYMHEWVSRWVTSDAVAAPVPRVISPWTGRPLPVRPYLQACFVWFGLLNLWSRALERGTADQAKARTRIKHTALGFLRDPLLEQLDAESRSAISESVQISIVTMQRRVKQSFAP